MATACVELFRWRVGCVVSAHGMLRCIVVSVSHKSTTSRYVYFQGRRPAHAPPEKRHRRGRIHAWVGEVNLRVQGENASVSVPVRAKSPTDVCYVSQLNFEDLNEQLPMAPTH